MPSSQARSSILAKLGDAARLAWDANKNNEVEYSSFGELPAGINNGIAQLVTCKFDLYKQGRDIDQPFFYAAGIVVQPKSHNNERVEGLRTQISEPLCDTPTRTRKTVHDHFKHVVAILQRLGLDTSSIDIDNIEDHLTALVNTKPYFRFRTFASKKQEIIDDNGKFFIQQEGQARKGPYRSVEELLKANPYAGNDPRTNHVWGEACEFEDENANGYVGVNDETSHQSSIEPMATQEPMVEGEEETPPAPVVKPKLGVKTTPTTTPPSTNKNGATQANPTPPSKPTPKTTPAPAKPVPKPQPKPTPTPPSPAPKAEEEMSEPFDEFANDLNTLAMNADNGDEDAQSKLQELAGDAGISNVVLAEANNWVEVVKLMMERGSKGGDSSEDSNEEGSEEKEECPYKNGDVWYYKPLDPKTKKKSAKAVECEIVSVDEDNQVVRLKRLDNPKTTYSSVAFGELESQ